MPDKENQRTKLTKLLLKESLIGLLYGCGSTKKIGNLRKKYPI